MNYDLPFFSWLVSVDFNLMIKKQSNSSRNVFVNKSIQYFLLLFQKGLYTKQHTVKLDVFKNYNKTPGVIKATYQMKEKRAQTQRLVSAFTSKLE